MDLVNSFSQKYAAKDTLGQLEACLWLFGLDCVLSSSVLIYLMFFFVNKTGKYSFFHLIKKYSTMNTQIWVWIVQSEEISAKFLKGAFDESL
jgi:hypothetical protein